MPEQHTACKVMCPELDRRSGTGRNSENHSDSACCVCECSSISRHRIHTLCRFAPQKTFRHFFFGKLNYFWLRKLIRASCTHIRVCNIRLARIGVDLWCLVSHNFAPISSTKCRCRSVRFEMSSKQLQIEIRDALSWTHNRHGTHARALWHGDGWWSYTSIHSLRHWSLSVYMGVLCVLLFCLASTFDVVMGFIRANCKYICTNHTDAKLTFQENDGTHEKWINCIFKYFPFDGGPRYLSTLLPALPYASAFVPFAISSVLHLTSVRWVTNRWILVPSLHSDANRISILLEESRNFYGSIALIVFAPRPADTS